MRVCIRGVLIVLLMMLGAVALAPQVTAIEPSSVVVAIARTPSGHGYWLMNAEGQVFPFGDALSFSLLNAFPEGDRPYVSLVAAQNGKGLWALAAGGKVNSLGRVPSVASGCPCEGICDCDTDPKGLVGLRDGNGLWVLLDNGQVETLGRVPHLGDFPPPPSGDTYIGMVATPSGRGLWAVTRGGRLSRLGRVSGSIADCPGSGCCDDEGPCQGLVGTSNGSGLWVLGADGHVDALGRAPVLGNMPPPLAGDGYTSMVATPSGHGLWAVTEGGQVGTVGDAVFLGDLTCTDCVCLSCVP